MKEVIESILLNTKEAYKESILIDNEKLQNLLLDALTSIKTLQNDIPNEPIVVEDKQTKKRYSYEQVKGITKVQIKLTNDLINMETAKKEILEIASFFPVHNLPAYNKRLKSYLDGIGSYGFAMPTNWAKALLEETNNNEKVIQALNEQQSLYMEKDGVNNQRLAKLLNEVK